MPGVSVLTETWAGPPAAPAPAHAAYHLAGMTERGPVGKPVTVRSLADLEAAFGGRVAYGAIHDDLRMFFAEGGGQAVVSRIVGPASVVGTIIIADTSSAPGVDTLQIDAANPGAWSDALAVEVESQAGTFALIVSYRGERVAKHAGLTTPQDAVAATAGSPWITVTDLASGSPAPTNNPKPGIYTLAGGTDDRANVVTAQIQDAIDVLASADKGGAIGLPGFDAATWGAVLIAHAVQNDRIALLAGSAGDDADTAMSKAEALIDAGGEYATYLYPFVTIPDGRGTRDVSPVGFAAACRTRAIRQYGPWRVPAGEIGKANFLLSPTVTLSRAQGDALDAAQVSAIRTIAGSTRLYGWRTLSPDLSDWPTLNARDLLNALAIACSEALEEFVFATIDASGQLLGRVESALVGVLDPVRAAGGLYERVDPTTGDRLDPGYSVTVDQTINPDQSLSGNELRAVVRVRIAPVGQEITLTIVKAALTAAL